jgi:hypothetical protein
MRRHPLDACRTGRKRTRDERSRSLSLVVGLPGLDRDLILIRDRRLSAVLSGLSAARADREWHRDGVKHADPRQLALVVYWRPAPNRSSCEASWPRPDGDAHHRPAPLSGEKNWLLGAEQLWGAVS